jgi:type IV secretion system protein VirB11
MSDVTPLLDHVGVSIWPLLKEDGVEDVAIQGPGEAWCCHQGRWSRREIAITKEDVEEIVTLSGSLNKREVDETAPLYDAHLPGGERLGVCAPPACARVTRDESGKIHIDPFPALTFRKHEESIAEPATIAQRYRTEGWNKWERRQGGRDWSKLLAIYDSGDFSGLLVAAVQARLNILQVGMTGVGKTTLNKTACSAIDDSERIITVEDVIELFLRQLNIVRMIFSNDEGGVGCAAILKTIFRHRATRVLLQELRDGPSAWTLCSDIIGPHPGVITTIHGHDAMSGISRLAMLLRSAPEARGMSTDDIGWLLNNSVDLVIPLHLGDDGVRDIFPVWFAGDAFRRGETVASLLREQ